MKLSFRVLELPACMGSVKSKCIFTFAGGMPNCKDLWMSIMQTSKIFIV